MAKQLQIYNTLTDKKEPFEPLNSPYVGMYVCGPTVYGDAHLGHARPAITFDVVFRYLKFLGYKVRYVRNITDVGHLENDEDEGEDKIAKKAKLEKLEPMEVVQHYTVGYHNDMQKLNVLSPSIEPYASGHIQEQIQLIKKIQEQGYAYEVNGTVYFDVKKYAEDYDYGKLSGRVIDDLLANTRDLEGQEEKHYPLDFALWKKATPEHLMKWESPWSVGYPGWHIECSAMSTRYLGEQFDIHGGGMDLLFPHHECEIAQCKAGYDEKPARYWMHNNMVTINGKKMGKSYDNFINLHQLFSGEHPILSRGFHPMTIRFFILQSHYRSTLDFSNEALEAGTKGYFRLMNGLKIVKKLEHPGQSSEEKRDDKLIKKINTYCDGCYQGMNDDFNTAVTLSHLFNMLKKINAINNGDVDAEALDKETFDRMKETYVGFVEDVLGLEEVSPVQVDRLVNSMLEVYKMAKKNQEYDKVDQIREFFRQEGIVIKDMKHKIDWAYEE